MKKRYIGMLASSCFAWVLVVQADTTVDSAHPYAYGANVGWINARGDITNGAVLGQSYCTGYLWNANCGWISLGNGPTNSWRYSNSSGGDWGVNHDGQGRLTGYAYGANIGWIRFEQTYGQPRVDLRTGNLSGYIFGANVGWLSLSNNQAYVRTTRLDGGPDTDGDGIPDPWEYSHTDNLAALSGSQHDLDGDGVTDTREYGADTDPLDANDHLKIVALTVSGNTNTVRWTARPTRTYRLVATNSLMGAGGAWPDAGPGVIGPPAGSSMEVSVTGVTQTTRFYRVKSIVPLSE
jgi:hypothetical protein